MIILCVEWDVKRFLIHWLSTRGSFKMPPGGILPFPRPFLRHRGRCRQMMLSTAASAICHRWTHTEIKL